MPPRRHKLVDMTPEELAAELAPDYPVDAGFLDWYAATADYCYNKVRSDEHGLVCRVAVAAGVGIADWFRAAVNHQDRDKLDARFGLYPLEAD